MSRVRLAAIAGTILFVAAAVWLFVERPAADRTAVQRLERGTAKTESGNAGSKNREPTLYCEFYNFADRTPLVGFYFLIEEASAKPAYTLIFQREQDGTQADFGGESAPRPQWKLDGSDSPAVLRAPDDAIQINLYDYDPKKPGVNWFEAGIRSVRYKNLGGKCRRSAA